MGCGCGQKKVAQTSNQQQQGSQVQPADRAVAASEARTPSDNRS